MISNFIVFLVYDDRPAFDGQQGATCQIDYRKV